MIRVLLFSLFIQLSVISFSQQDSSIRKVEHQFEINSFYRLQDKFSGSEVLYNFSYKRKNFKQIGISFGMFYHTKLSSVDSDISRFDYLHFPIYLTFHRKNKKGTHAFQSKFGYVLKTFYDTHALVYTPEKIFWASANDLEEQIQYVFRRNHWLVISFDHKIKIYNHLALMYGLNFHLFANKSPAVINKAWSDREVNLGVFSFAHLGLNYSF